MSNFIDIAGKSIALGLGAEYVSSDGKRGADPVTVMTGIRFTSQMFNAMNNCTFIFDPDWKNALQGTLPICFFFVKSMNEVMTAKTATKPLIFYHEDNGKTDASKKAVTQVITDNTVIEPKTYQLEVLVPYDMTQIMTMQPVMNFTTMHSALNLKETAPLEKASSVAVACVKAIFDMFGATYSINMSNLRTATIDSVSEKDYNKKSLEAMWKNRSLCIMKLWSGWDFKDVVITNMSINKQPTEDNIYRGSITVQEVPVLTMLASNTLLGKDYLESIKQQKAKLENALHTQAIDKLNTEK
jgi:hypothetical protein